MSEMGGKRPFDVQRSKTMKIIGGSFFHGIGSKNLLIGSAIIGVPLAILWVLGVTLLRPEPIERAAVLGCYIAGSAPSLEVRPDIIRVGQRDARSFHYVVEPAKEGYRMSVRPAQGLRLNDGEYAFAPERGTGYYWPLLPQGSDDHRRMREPTDFGGRFSMIANDGTPIIYTRVSAGACS